MSHLALQLGLLPLVSPQASCWSGAALQRAAGGRAGGRTSGCNKERGKKEEHNDRLIPRDRMRKGKKGKINLLDYFYLKY